MHTLLIVEDEKLIRQGIKAMVQRSGVPVDNILECGNGEAALEILRMQRVDVMFTDIRMPKMDGIQLVNAMQELPDRPLTVAVSGYDDFSYAVELMRMGVREYLLKPVDRDKVKEILEKFNDELEERRRNKKQAFSMSRQQLKYLLLSERLTEEERALLIHQFQDSFSGESYRVLCTNKTGEESCVEAGMPYLCLGNVEEKGLYIVGCDFLPIFLKEEMDGRFVGISSAHREPEELKTAYEEACRARKEAFYLNKPAVYFEQMSTAKSGKIPLEEAFMLQLVQLLGTDKYEDALRQLNRIFKNASLGTYEPSVVEKGMRILLDGIQSTYAGVLKTDTKEIADYYRLYSFSCMEEYSAEVSGWLFSFCNTLNSRFDDYKNKQKIQQAVIYIRENYDKDLNMAVVSNHISMNYSLFSYVFKQYTGKNFVNFLKDIRVEEAKRLLEETDMKVIDISMSVGYENEKNFMKIFKAACGVSPTEYRKNMLYKG